MNKAALIALLPLAALASLLHSFIPADERDFPAPPKKPAAPFDLDLRTVGRPDPGVPFGLVVAATSRIAGEVTVEVSIPPGAEHLAGEARWSGRLRAGETRRLRLDLSVPDRDRREIFVTVQCAVDGKTRLARCASLVLHDAPVAAQGVPGRNARGEGILDFRQP